MATNTVKPDGDSLIQWSDPSIPPDHYTHVDEYPGAADFDSVSALETGGDDDDLEIFTMTTFDAIAANSITQIVVYTTGVIAGTHTPEINVSFDNGANWEGEQECVLVSTGMTEVSNTWAGLSYSKADLDLLLIKYIADVPDKENANIIDRIYAVITYTVAGYGHDFMGVPAANIDEVNGVPSANIDTIKGV